MAKKVAISITIDGDVLRTLDNALREIQSREVSKGKLRSNRSTLIEGIVQEWTSR